MTLSVEQDCRQGFVRKYSYIVVVLWGFMEFIVKMVFKGAFEVVASWQAPLLKNIDGSGH